MVKKLVTMVLASSLFAATALLTSSCGSAAAAAVVSALPDVLAGVTDGVQIVDSIEAFIHAYFAARPDATAQANVDAAIAKTRAALNATLRLAQATKEMNDSQVDAAFADFKTAYVQLLALVGPYGVVSTAPAAAVDAGAAPFASRLRPAPGQSQLIVPEPLAFHLAKR